MSQERSHFVAIPRSSLTLNIHRYLPVTHSSWIMHRQHRLTREQDFARVRAQGRSWSHRLLVLYAAPNDLGYPRWGFAAARRLGSAVARNRARRLLREAARLVLPSTQGGWDIVLIAREAMRDVRMQQVRDALEQTLRRAHLAQPADGAPSRGPSHREEGMPS